jgi:dTDP-4-amino-4,6-dideoxygalactose transaminase
VLAEDYRERALLLTSSGTHALQLALAVTRAVRGDGPVAMPAYACFDLATAALGAGTRVRLYDVDPLTLQPDPDSLARAVGDDATAVVIVHLYGLPVPLGPVRAIAARTGAIVIEDAAQAIGAHIGGQPAGMQGDLGVLSFGRGKGVSGGGGGALVVAEALRSAAYELFASAVATRANAVPLMVKGLAQWLLARPALYGIPSRLPLLRLGETIYHAPTPVGAMPPAVARTLLHTWPLRTEEHRRRVTNANVLRSVLAELTPEGLAPIPPNTQPGWLRFPFVLPEGSTPNRAAAELGIVPAYPISLEALVPFQSALLPLPHPLHGARALAARLWTLPTHGALRPRDLESLVTWMRQVLLNRP